MTEPQIAHKVKHLETEIAMLRNRLTRLESRVGTDSEARRKDKELAQLTKLVPQMKKYFSR